MLIENCDSCGGDHELEGLMYMFPNGDWARVCEECQEEFTIDELWGRIDNA